MYLARMFILYRLHVISSIFSRVGKSKRNARRSSMCKLRIIYEIIPISKYYKSGLKFPAIRIYPIMMHCPFHFPVKLCCRGSEIVGASAEVRASVYGFLSSGRNYIYTIGIGRCIHNFVDYDNYDMV